MQQSNSENLCVTELCVFIETSVAKVFSMPINQIILLRLSYFYGK